MFPSVILLQTVPNPFLGQENDPGKRLSSADLVGLAEEIASKEWT